MCLASPIIVLAANVAAPSLHEAASLAQPVLSILHETTVQIVASGTAMGAAVVHGCCVCVGGMTASAFHFDLYAGLAGGAMLQAWHACSNRRHEQAREHGMACLVHVIAALLQWHA